jgi:hypothetical protein
MSYGATQIYILPFRGTTIEAQATCRLWELRGFTVISVTGSLINDNPINDAIWVITMRASSMLYVNWMMGSEGYQAGSFDGQAEAEAGERKIILRFGLDVVKDCYITAQRDHDRTWIGAETL